MEQEMDFENDFMPASREDMRPEASSNQLPWQEECRRQFVTFTIDILKWCWEKAKNEWQHATLGQKIGIVVFTLIAIVTMGTCIQHFAK